MTISEREKQFKEKVFETPFSEIAEEFFLYWSEPNKSGTKLRFELEKTWDLGRRLKRWQAIKDSRREFNPVRIAKVEKVLTRIPTNDYERLEAFFNLYIFRPTMIPFEKFGQYFDSMKEMALLKTLTEDEKKMLKNVYGKCGEKLRCAWVQITLDNFMITGYDWKR